MSAISLRPLAEELRRKEWVECTLGECTPREEVAFEVLGDDRQEPIRVLGKIARVTEDDVMMVDHAHLRPDHPAMRAPRENELQRQVTLSDVIAQAGRVAIAQGRRRKDFQQYPIRWNGAEHHFQVYLGKRWHQAKEVLEVPLLGWADQLDGAPNDYMNWD